MRFRRVWTRQHHWRIGLWNGQVYSFSPQGAVNWTFGTGNSISCSPSIGSDGTIYIGSFDDKLYAISKTGGLLWTVKTGGWVEGTSPAIGADGTVYFGSTGFWAIK